METLSIEDDMSNGMSIKNEKEKKERWIKERLMKFLKYESNIMYMTKEDEDRYKRERKKKKEADTVRHA